MIHTRVRLCSIFITVVFGFQLSAVAETPDEMLARSRKNLTQIALAFHKYHEQYGKLPGFANVDESGSPHLSWRVHLLPFLGDREKDLYSQFHIHEPWDSPHNKQLIDQMPTIYDVPLSDRLERGHTTYLVPRSDLSLFPSTANNNKWQVTFSDVYQGLPNIVLAVEADRQAAVPWTQPTDHAFDSSRPLFQLGNLRSCGFLVSWASGEIAFIPNDVLIDRADRTEFLRGMFERVGGRGLSFYLGLK